MYLSALLAAVLAFQIVNAPPSEREPDLRSIISDDAALGSTKILYSVDTRLVAVRGDGIVLMQSTGQQLPLLPTCRGRVPVEEVRRLLETMLHEQFLDLPQKTYMTMGEEEDWRRLRLHSISISTTGRSAKRDFFAGKYGGKHQEFPERFVTIEKAIDELESKAIPKGTHCTVAPRSGLKTKRCPRFVDCCNITIALKTSRSLTRPRARGRTYGANL